MRNISNLQTQKTKLLADATALVNAGLKTLEQKESYRKLLADADIVQSDIDSLARIERAMPSLPKPSVSASPVIEVVPESAEKRRAKLNSAARSFFNHGASGLNAEQRAILTTSDTAGGALISQSFDDVFVEAAKFFGNIFNMVHRKDAPDGSPIKTVTTDTTAQSFSLVTQGTTSASGVAQTPTVFSNIVDVDDLVSSSFSRHKS